MMSKIAGMAADSNRTTVLWVHDQQGGQALADVEVHCEIYCAIYLFISLLPNYNCFRYNKALNISPPSSPESTVNFLKPFVMK